MLSSCSTESVGLLQLFRHAIDRSCAAHRTGADSQGRWSGAGRRAQVRGRTGSEPERAPRPGRRACPRPGAGTASARSTPRRRTRRGPPPIPVRTPAAGARPARPPAGWCRCRRRPRRTRAAGHGGERPGRVRPAAAPAGRRPAPPPPSRERAAPPVGAVYERGIEPGVRHVRHAARRPARSGPVRRPSSVTTTTRPTAGHASAALTVSAAMASTSASWSASGSEAAQPRLRTVQPLHRNHHRPELHQVILTASARGERLSSADVTSASSRCVDTGPARDEDLILVGSSGRWRRCSGAASGSGCGSPSSCVRPLLWFCTKPEWRGQEQHPGHRPGDPRVQPHLLRGPVRRRALRLRPAARAAVPRQGVAVPASRSAGTSCARSGRSRCTGTRRTPGRRWRPPSTR